MDAIEVSAASKGSLRAMVSIFLFSKVQEPLSPTQQEFLEANLKREFDGTWREVGNGNYLVATQKPMITQDATKLSGVVDGSAGAYIVTNLEPYYGWASKSTWEWISTMKGQDERS